MTCPVGTDDDTRGGRDVDVTYSEETKRKRHKKGGRYTGGAWREVGAALRDWRATLSALELAAAAGAGREGVTYTTSVHENERERER